MRPSQTAAFISAALAPGAGSSSRASDAVGSGAGPSTAHARYAGLPVGRGGGGGGESSIGGGASATAAAQSSAAAAAVEEAREALERERASFAEERDRMSAAHRRRMTELESA